MWEEGGQMADQAMPPAFEARQGGMESREWWMRLAVAAPRLHATLERDALLSAATQAMAEVTQAPAALFLLGGSDGEFEPFRLHGHAAAMGALEERRSVRAEWRTGDAEDAHGAALLLPLIQDGRPLGAIQALCNRPDALPADALAVLDALAASLSLALATADGYAHVVAQGAALTREVAELRRASLIKSQFLATMSHELRTPLTSIVGFASMLLRGRSGEGLSEQQRDNTARILAAARRLVALVNDILDLSRIEAGRLDIFRRDVDLEWLLESVRDEIEPLARARGLTLAVRVDPGLGRLVTDPDRFRQVLTNLVDNAIKFTPMGSVSLHARQDGERIAIDVADSGIGIAPDERERVFSDFYQVDQSSTRAAGGTGLGLAICRKLVGLLDGTLTLWSVLGEGSTFTVSVPAAAGVAGPRTPAMVHRGQVSERGERILMIDSDPEMLLLEERALEGTGYWLVGARTAEEGLQMARDLQPSVILLDVMLPEMDGWRVLHRLKTDPQTAGIPVVMHSVVDDKLLGLSLGATDYLIKPVEREQLLSALDRLAGHDQAGPVLVVDDDEGIRQMLAEMLHAEGFATAQARDGHEALAVAIAQPPRVILLDLLLPDLDGFAVLGRLRSLPQTRQVPVVVLTGRTLTQEEEALLHSEAAMVLSKTGMDLERLVQAVRTVVEAE